jgi:hypothetical protein
MERYQSEADIENVVRGFESCETGADDFAHPEHLVVAVAYLHVMDRDEALARMRAGLLRFLQHYEGHTGKYSEEITVFWIDNIAEKLKELGPDVSLVEKCNTILAADFTDQSRGSRS